MGLQPVAVLLVGFVLILSGVLPVAFAEGLTGKFVEYSVDAEHKNRATRGVVRSEAATDYGNGTVRAKFSGALGDTVFLIEKNLPNRTVFPILPSLPEGTITYSLHGKNLTLTITSLGSESIEFNGTIHTVNVTRIDLRLASENQTFEASATLKTFQSGLLYSLNSTAQSGTFRLVAVLEETNLDLESNAPPPSPAALAALLGSMAGARLYAPPGSAEPGQPEADGPTNTLLGVSAAVGVGAAVGILAFRRRLNNRGRPPESRGSKPPHWVH